MTGVELRELSARLYELDLAIGEYLKMRAITSISLFFNGYNSLSVAGESVDEVREAMTRRAASVVREKVLWLRDRGVDATSEMPEELR